MKTPPLNSSTPQNLTPSKPEDKKDSSTTSTVLKTALACASFTLLIYYCQRPTLGVVSEKSFESCDDINALFKERNYCPSEAYNRYFHSKDLHHVELFKKCVSEGQLNLPKRATLCNEHLEEQIMRFLPQEKTYFESFFARESYHGSLSSTCETLKEYYQQTTQYLLEQLGMDLENAAKKIEGLSNWSFKSYLDKICSKM